jgi:hypothetical protein
LKSRAPSASTAVDLIRARWSDIVVVAGLTGLQQLVPGINREVTSARAVEIILAMRRPLLLFKKDCDLAKVLP